MPYMISIQISICIEKIISRFNFSKNDLIIWHHFNDIIRKINLNLFENQLWLIYWTINDVRISEPIRLFKIYDPEKKHNRHGSSDTSIQYLND